MEIQAADEAARAVSLGILALDEVRVAESDELTDREMCTVEGRIRAEMGGRPPSRIAELAPARVLYRAAGIDPTRYRPSSEALVRRVVKGGALPRINAAVDLCNLAAVSYFLPIGLYDAGRIRGPVRLRLGREDESYPGIRKEKVGLAGRLLLEDDEGPFGNPSSDSARTAVTESASRLLWVIFAPGDYPRRELAAHIEWSRSRAVERLGGTARVGIQGGA
jgi:DNA/RNA-binding domain of Phe-tRNA-synthetase-like protein